jgi:2-polyprenyl-3-methyl-5-hydroxy-6-metoxy-1,4-benzoquinol methylase
MNKTQIAVDVFNNNALKYQEKFMYFDLYNDTFDTFCSHIHKQNAAVLDIACGPGNISKYLLSKRPDFQIFGIDLAPNMIDLARINNPGARFEIMDCRDIGQLQQKFDAVMCGFALPYLSKEDAVQLIEDAALILNPGGVFYISTMEDDYANSGPKKSSDGKSELYQYLHQADYLIEALQASGFEIVEVQRKDFPTTDGTKTVDLVIQSKKQP